MLLINDVYATRVIRKNVLRNSYSSRINISGERATFSSLFLRCHYLKLASKVDGRKGRIKKFKDGTNERSK